MLARFFNEDTDEGRDVGRYAFTAVRAEFPHPGRGRVGPASGIPVDMGMAA